MHWVQALIAPNKVMAEIRQFVPPATVCPIAQNLSLVPITEEVEACLQASEFASRDPAEPLADEIALGVVSLAAKLSALGPVVYAATFIHGGTGGQDALVWIDNQLVLKVHDDEDNMSAWPNSPISRALRHIGVTTKEGEDEFDAIGLGKHRSNDSWAQAYASA